MSELVIDRSPPLLLLLHTRRPTVSGLPSGGCAVLPLGELHTVSLVTRGAATAPAVQSPSFCRRHLAELTLSLMKSTSTDDDEDDDRLASTAAVKLHVDNFPPAGERCSTFAVDTVVDDDVSDDDLASLPSGALLGVLNAVREARLCVTLSPSKSVDRRRRSSSSVVELLLQLLDDCGFCITDSRRVPSSRTAVFLRRPDNRHFLSPSFAVSRLPSLAATSRTDEASLVSLFRVRLDDRRDFFMPLSLDDDDDDDRELEKPSLVFD
jgi:hypothetical protein